MVDLTPAVVGVVVGLAICIVVLIIVLIVFFSGSRPLIEGYVDPYAGVDKYRFTGSTGYISEQEALRVQQQRLVTQNDWVPVTTAVPVTQTRTQTRMYLPEAQPVPPASPPFQRMAEISSNQQQFGWRAQGESQPSNMGGQGFFQPYN